MFLPISVFGYQHPCRASATGWVLLPHLHVTPSLLRVDASSQGCLGSSVFEAPGSSPLLSLLWTAHKQLLSVSLANRKKILLEFRLQHANSSIFQAEQQGWSKASRHKPMHPSGTVKTEKHPED